MIENKDIYPTGEIAYLEKNFRGLGIGTDIEDISRFEKLTILKDERFFEKIFTPCEVSYCFSKSNPGIHLAARFSGKEAVIKALYSAGLEGLVYSEIEILNDETGMPFVKIHKNDFKAIKIKISLSHSQDKSLAFAIVFKD
jgi:holo-[acyl-carrier protein] synthase